MKDEEKKTILYNDEEISEWRYYEIKMNECFENGDKEQALQYKEKFINLYRQEKKEDSKKPKSEPITEVDSANNETLIGDYNKFKEQYLEELPSIKKQFKDQGIPFPKDVWKLLGVAIERRHIEGGEELSFDDFLKASIQIKKERENKVNDTLFIQRKILSHSAKKRVSSFCRSVAKKNPEEAKEFFLVLELILAERPGFDPMRNKTETIQEIETHESYNGKNLKSVSPQTKSSWINKYVEQYL